MSLEAQLDDEPALERHGLTEHGHDAGEEPIEHEELPTTRELGPGLPRRAEPLFERLPERGRG